MAACPACGKDLPGEFPFCPFCTAPLTGESREQRKTVTVLFCDVTGSTALGESTDPEALRALLARYFERMKAIVESHGGTVEKFIGDAVMAVFGVPVAHEDDALRAVRAAAEMRDALPELGVQARIGVNTGEVVTGTEERLATGDVVNVAARLEQSARSGEVLLGAETMQLVEEAVEAESVEPFALKGKRERVRAFRLLHVGEAPERVHGEAFVGRERELGEIAAAWARAADGRCELVSIVAEAGVGKTRLAAEALGRLDARVVRGRCLSYGEGITYWPVVEVVKQLAVRPSDPAAAAAIASLLGESEAGTSAEEIAWAFRKLLEEQAPLVCLFEDIHQGEETFLDLVEHVALLSAGGQVLLVCTARPELLERRPSWPVALRLAPLEPVEVDRLVPASLPAQLREQIARAAGGNPLFVTEMVAMAEATDGEVTVPPTLRALLTARLDQVDAAERRVLERGAVEGEIFHRGAVQALAFDEPQVTARLAALVRRELVRPEPAQIPGEDGFRFRHLLIRDAAYEALPKSTRADLHERFATWLEQRGQGLVELDEILGYHLERASRYKSELGYPEAVLAEKAGRRLAAAGRRALWRNDDRASALLLERALKLTRPLRLDVNLELDLAEAQQAPQAQAEIALQAANRAREIGDRAAEAVARVIVAKSDLEFSGADVADDLERLAGQALALLDPEDGAARGRVWYALSELANFRARFEERALAAEQALQCFELAKAHHFELAGLHWALILGPRPADLALETLDSFLATSPAPLGLVGRAHLLAMLDRFDEAWELALPIAERLREASEASDIDLSLGQIAVLAGEHELAVQYLRRGCDTLERLGMKAHLSSYAPELGHSLCQLGLYEDAEPLARLGRELGHEQDLMTQAWWRRVQALVQGSRGEHAEAERLARESIAITEQTDALTMQGSAYIDLAEVLSKAGKPDEAHVALEQAVDRYTRKKNLAMLAQVRPRLDALRELRRAGR